eukprot:167222-Prorocentrum_minimum.AAC.1
MPVNNDGETLVLQERCSVCLPRMLWRPWTDPRSCIAKVMYSQGPGIRCEHLLAACLPGPGGPCGVGKGGGSYGQRRMGEAGEEGACGVLLRASCPSRALTGAGAGCGFPGGAESGCG